MTHAHGGLQEHATIVAGLPAYKGLSQPMQAKQLCDHHLHSGHGTAETGQTAKYFGHWKAKAAKYFGHWKAKAAKYFGHWKAKAAKYFGHWKAKAAKYFDHWQAKAAKYFGHWKAKAAM
eukprot:1159774-Pelagomonas_calceolata.AAC.9